ncbi:acetyltransferase [Rodentibacter trehalosifermentans]|uniref:Shikimate dehydrogenase n=1 Tax=Rodentibacter trehalosifermentans TaxID=1908263 RepID=A0A1V3ITT3_9PAST|nr:acetyltransferase [Rodentibacter trehalosifermentans]OOF45511.1 shikimate dehydrogenase [Rodentibacter trehalosifermentans]OOF47365.1 shikimate dehydrogenase [Rodentibacter trehalosifermentans]
MKKKVIFIGAGGYAKSVLDSLDTSLYEFCGFIDNFKPEGTTHLGYPILAKTIDEFKERNNYSFFISIGNNNYRLEKYLKLEKYQCNIISIIDRTSIISNHSTLGKGVFVGKMAIVNSGVTIGNNVIINTKSLVEHGCRIGNHSNVSTNSTLNGDVIVEDYCFIGSSSVITGQLRIGESAIVGAGAVVIRNVKPRTVVAGVPAKLIKEVE